MQRVSAYEPTRADRIQRASRSYSSARAIIAGRQEADDDDDDDDDDRTDDSIPEEKRAELLALLKRRVSPLASCKYLGYKQWLMR